MHYVKSFSQHNWIDFVQILPDWKYVRWYVYEAVGNNEIETIAIKFEITGLRGSIWIQLCEPCFILFIWYSEFIFLITKISHPINIYKGVFSLVQYLQRICSIKLMSNSYISKIWFNDYGSNNTIKMIRIRNKSSIRKDNNKIRIILRQEIRNRKEIKGYG